MKNFLNVLALTIMAASAVIAGTISITLDNPNQTGSPGETLQFFGTIINSDTNGADAPIYLNLDSLNLALGDASANDLFLSNVPIDLAPGTVSGDIDLFEYTLANPESNSFGLYSGTYVLLGGADAGADTAQGSLAQAAFSVSVNSSATPEPATVCLLGMCMALLGLLYRERQTKARNVNCG
jgi:hypothetical protein